MNFLEFLQLNHNYYVFIRHLVHWDQIQHGNVNLESAPVNVNLEVPLESNQY